MHLRRAGTGRAGREWGHDPAELRRTWRRRPRGTGRSARGGGAGRRPGRVERDEAGEPPSPVIIDVTEETFQAEVLDRSMTVPVVLDFWATWCQPCTQLSPILERFAEDDAGAWILARIDVDANQRLSQAAQVQSIPTVHVVWQGQLVPGFTGALPEAQVRAFLDQVRLLAAAEGTAGDGGRRWPTPTSTPRPTPWTRVTSTPRKRRTTPCSPSAPVTPTAARDSRPSRCCAGRPAQTSRRCWPRPRPARRTSAAQLAAADLEFATGQVDEAFDRLVAGVRRSAGPDRELLRGRLVELFDLLPADDPRLARARTALASALF